MSSSSSDDDKELARASKVTRVDSGDPGIQLGQWYWMDVTVSRDVYFERPVRETHNRAKAAAARGDDHPADFIGRKYQEVKERALLCVTEIGSNYAKLTGSPYESQGYGRWHSWRVHFNEFSERCTLEPDAKRIIQQNILTHRQNAATLMAKVQEEMERLGVVKRHGLTDGATELAGTSTALAKSKGLEVKQYSRDLQRAQRIDIPHWFEQIKIENKLQAQWMKAEMLPLRAHADRMKPLQEAIEARLLNVELYAGLVEQVKQVRKGEPAPMDTPVHLLQRRHYMDEECLANYEAGGMDYQDLADFDKWLARDDNFNRVLPFARSVVAFRIRRYDRHREARVPTDYITFAQEQEEDRRTFLYLRNGERLYRLETKHDFGEQLFPDFDVSNTSDSQLYYRRESHDKFEYEIISAERLAGMKEEEAAEMAAEKARFHRDKAAALAKGERWTDEKEWSPRSFRYRVEQDSLEFKPLNTDSVYYDDVVEEMQAQILSHNRVAMVLQGLMDRSEVFHPHPKWELWNGAGFEQAVKLVYDDSRALVPGPKPDFEAYRARLNATLAKGSMVTGVYEPWLEKEREKQQERNAANWRLSWEQKRVSEYWRPPYDGPQVVHVVDAVGKNGVRVRWTRERMTDRSWRSRGDQLTMTFTAPVSKVLNVSAYTRGDFRQFFADPRTRADYLKWAPLLLAAEDWHAGKQPKGKRRK